jgi:hypothetical protein
MAFPEVERRFREFLGSAGRPALGALFPNDFEVYMMMLELVDSEGNVAEYLSFPVLPNDITKSEPELTNIKKTARGVISVSSESFNPQDITINGNFGRSFKILLGANLVDFKAFSESWKALKKGKVRKAFKKFDNNVTTGFGCTKIMQAILNKSTKLDPRNKPYKLYFHNPTFGESYLVEKTNSTFRQDKNTTNMMWAYSVSFKILANTEDIVGETGASSFRQTLAKGFIQGGVNKLAGNVGEILRKDAATPLGVGQVGKAINLFGGNVRF